jgi:hypothetical protein
VTLFLGGLAIVGAGAIIYIILATARDADGKESDILAALAAGLVLLLLVGLVATLAAP